MKPVILIVDDHPDILEFLKEVLEDDYILLTASNGQIALDILKREIINIIVIHVIWYFFAKHIIKNTMME